MDNYTVKNSHRITQAEKNANDFQWYKDKADMFDKHSFQGTTSFFSNKEGGVVGGGTQSEFMRKKTNYDLFNNVLDIRQLEYVCKPFGENGGNLPATFANRDIVSGKIKVLLGMEMKMPFSWRVIAVNEEATTRKEQAEFGKIRNFVVGEIMSPIKQAIAKQQQEQTKGRQLTPAEEQQLQQQIDAQVKAQTPDEVRRYMAREHQDPAEALSRQLLEYLILDKNISYKFNKGWKHSTLSGEEVYWVGERNGEPDVVPVNSLYFDYDKSPDLDFIEDGEWAVCEYRMTPSQVVAEFGSKLTDDQIDKIYRFENDPARVADTEFTFTGLPSEPFTIRVKHSTFKSLRKIGFLTYMDNGKEQEKLVDENYRLKREEGDVSIEWEWIPEAHEVYKILSDIYVYARPIPGQHKDLDNLYICKLPYFGASCDSLNSPTTSPMDRMKHYQYLYNIIIYRIELLMASDKGKILAMNVNSIPKTAGIDTDKFLYFMEANHLAFLNPNEEGNKGQHDITNMVKEIDMSLVSDIDKYIKIAEYIKAQCGYSIGVTPQMEAQIAPNEAVTNTKQNLVQSSYIIQPYFELHNTVKGNVLQGLLETAKVVYSQSKPKKLSYILDDMTFNMLTTNPELLENSRLGLFVSNSTKAAQAKQAVESLSQAAMQNQQATLLDIVKIIKAESVNEAEELLEIAQSREGDRQAALEKMKQDAQDKIEAAKQRDVLAERDHEIKMIITKETERRKTEIEKQAILSEGFNTNHDVDNDGVPDVLEIAKHGLNADIQNRKLSLDEQKLAQKTQHDDKKLKLEAKKIATQAKPASAN